jgi:membrane-anchored glycerophosphoryl diester phosphodiesterase (GDPDase)
MKKAGINHTDLFIKLLNQIPQKGIHQQDVLHLQSPFAFLLTFLIFILSLLFVVKLLLFIPMDARQQASPTILIKRGPTFLKMDI